MLNYQKLTLTDLSGGLTDNYKPSTNAKFRILKNFVTTDNRKLRTRNGTSPLCEMQTNIRSIDKINDRIVAVCGSYLSNYKDGIVVNTSASFPNSNQIVTTAKHKGSLLINFSGGNSLKLVTYKAAGVIAIRNASLPLLTLSSGEVVGGGYLAAILAYREYTDENGNRFVDYGPETIIETDSSTAIVLSADIATTLATYTGNSDTVGAVIFITELNGTVFYRNSSITTGTSISKSAIVNNTEILSVEQELIKRQAPLCEFFTIAGGVAWYASIMDSGNNRANRAWHSVDGIPHSVISSAYVDFDSRINGVKSLNSLPIFLTDDGVYRVDGNIGIDGSGFIRKVRIQNSEGGISNNSMVIANDVMYYFGTDGIYATDGYSAKNITGAERYETYISYIKVKADWQKIAGTFDADNNCIYWRVKDNVLLYLDLETGSLSELEFPTEFIIKSIASVFFPRNAILMQATYDSNVVDGIYTDITYTGYERYVKEGETIGAVISTSVYSGLVKTIDELAGTVTIRFLTSLAVPLAGTATIIENYGQDIRKLLIGTDKKTLIQSTDFDMSDVIPSSIETDSTKWSRTHIDHDLLTAGIDYGSPSIRKWVSQITTILRSDFKFALKQYIVNDDDGNDTYMKRISSISQGIAFDSDDVSFSEIGESYPKSLVTARRHIPKGKCRCRANQIGLKSSETDLYNSINYGIIKVESETADDITVSIEKDSEVVLFPYDLKGKLISIRPNTLIEGLDSSDFSSKVQITDQASDRTTITLLKPNDIRILSTGEYYDFTIYGKQTRQRIEIDAFEIDFALIANTVNGYNGQSTPEGQHG